MRTGHWPRALARGQLKPGPHTSGFQRLHPALRPQDLSDRPPICARGPARSQCADRIEARRIHRRALRLPLSGRQLVRAAPQTGGSRSSGSTPIAPAIGSLPAQPSRAIPVQNGAVASSQKRSHTHSAIPANFLRSAGPTSPGDLRVSDAKPPLRNLTQSKTGPPPQVGRGPLPIASGADSVASALHQPLGRDSGGQTHPSMHSPPYSSKPDVSTWQTLGHFYLALTACQRAARGGRRARLSAR
jgi:hypothetical protein